MAHTRLLLTHIRLIFRSYQVTEHLALVQYAYIAGTEPGGFLRQVKFLGVLMVWLGVLRGSTLTFTVPVPASSPGCTGEAAAADRTQAED